MRGKAGKAVILSLKILVSLALLAWVLSKVEWEEFSRAIRGIDPALLVPGVLLFVLSTLMIGYRWWRLVAIQGTRISLWEATRLTFLGTFYNYVIPGSTGGDLIKAYYLSHHGLSKTTSLVTVVVDRLLGLTGLTLLAAMMLAVLFALRWARPGSGGVDDAHQLVLAALAVGVVLAVLVVACTVLLSRRLRRWLRLERLCMRLPLARQILAARDATVRYRAHLLSVAWAMGQTLLAQMAFIAGILLVGVSLGLPVPWHAYFVYVPLIYIIAAVPVVPGGIGLAESFYITFFTAWAGESEILALALLARLIPMFWAMPGLVVAIRGARVPSRDQMEAELAGSAEAKVPQGVTL